MQTTESATTDRAAGGPVYVAPDNDERDYKRYGTYGAMYAGDYGWSVERCIREAYNDMDEPTDTRSLHFHTPMLSKARAAAACEHMPERYNDFNREAAAQFVEALPEDAAVSIGREYSPVLYVWLSGAPTADPAVAAAEEAFDIRQRTYTDLQGNEFHDTVNTHPNEWSAHQTPRTGDHQRWQFIPGTGTLIRLWWD